MSTNNPADFVLLDCQANASDGRVIAVLTVTTAADHAEGEVSAISLRMLPEEADLLSTFLADAAREAGAMSPEPSR